MGLVAPQRMESSRTRDQTSVPCIDRGILTHCITRETQFCVVIDEDLQEPRASFTNDNGGGGASNSLVLFNGLCLGLTGVSSVPWVMSMCQEGGSGCHFCGCSPGLDYRYYLYYSFFTGFFGKPLDCLGRFICLKLQ